MDAPTAAQAADNAAYVACIVEDSLRLSRMFDPKYGEPEFRSSEKSDDDDDYDDDDDFYGFYENDAPSFPPSGAAASAPKQKKKEETKKRKPAPGKGGQPKRAKEVGVVAAPLLRKKDMKTWKHASHNPNAKEFTKNCVVGRFFVLKVDRKDPEEATVWLRRFLGNPVVLEVQKDDGGEFFEFEGEETRPSTAPDCDDDVDAARERQEQRKVEKTATKKKQARVRSRAKRERLDREAVEYAEAARTRAPETLHVGDYIRYQNPVLERQWIETQVLAMRDPSGQVSWERKLNWEFDGIFAATLEENSYVKIVRRKGSSANTAGKFSWPLSTFLLPDVYEPRIDSEQAKNARRVLAEANEGIEEAFSKYASGGGSSSSSRVEDVYKKIRF